MDINEIRESGLLELYVIGDCSSAENQIVEDALKSFPELKKDIYQIGAALEKYATINSITPSEGIKENILRKVKSSSKEGFKATSKNNTSIPKWLGSLLGIVSIILGCLLYNSTSKNRVLESDLIEQNILCDSIQQAVNQQYATLELLRDTDNVLLPITSTKKYPETSIAIIYNDQERNNFLQIQNLPEISDQQSFQLWSLKPDTNPIPLTVFQGSEGFIIPIDFEPGTATYAITIENRGGVDQPTLDDLIGTVNVPV